MNNDLVTTNIINGGNTDLTPIEIMSKSQKEEDIKSIEYALELIKRLKISNDFKECYYEVHQYMGKITSPKAFNYIIKYLSQKFIETDDNNFLYFSTDLIFYLIEKEKIYVSELNMHNHIVKDFNKIFPDLIFIKSEHSHQTGRTDIFAREKDTNRDVIMELKKDDTDTYEQLMRYKINYNNPILVSITRKIPKTTHKDIKYYLYSNVIA